MGKGGKGVKEEKEGSWSLAALSAGACCSITLLRVTDPWPAGRIEPGAKPLISLVSPWTGRDLVFSGDGRRAVVLSLALAREHGTWSLGDEPAEYAVIHRGFGCHLLCIS